MAGDWIKMRVDLADDPAVIKIAARLDLCEDTVVGKLHRLWSWFDQQTTNGNAPGVTAAWIDRRCNCSGLASAMIEAGWLSESPAGMLMPDFDKHNGQSGKARALSTKRTQKARAKCHADAVTDVHAPSVTEARPEKRREDKREEEISSSPVSSKKPTSSSLARPGWEEVEEGLRRLDVSLIKQALDSAIEHRFTPPQVLALIAYLETKPPGCKSAKGAIYNRLVAQAADAVNWDCDAHWPWSDSATSGSDKPTEAYPVQPVKVDRAAEIEQSRKRAAEQQRLIDLHAATLATMDQTELENLIAEAPERSRDGLRKQVYAKGRDSPLAHQTLLGLLDARQLAAS